MSRSRDFEKANRRDLVKSSYSPIASFKPARSTPRSRRRRAQMLAARARILEERQRAYWPQKFVSAVAGDKPGQPDLTGNTNTPCGESGTYPEGMGNPSLRNNK